MSEAYDLRSNIKGKPGSQGTLFQVKDKGLLNPDMRWPRGYTPERQAEVNANLHGATSPYLLSDQAGTGPQRREMNETIKRSTVPAEHLSGARFFPGQVGLAGDTPTRQTLGQYSGSAQGTSPQISIKRGQEGTDTVIHEIGHHVSSVSGTEHSAYQTGTQRGTEEAFADNYAYDHFRDRRGEKLPEMRIYPTPQHHDASHRMNFNMGYHSTRSPEIPMPDVLNARNRTPQQQQFVDAKEAESQGQTLFTTWDNGEDVSFHENTPSRGYSLGEKIGHTPKGRRP